MKKSAGKHPIVPEGDILLLRIHGEFDLEDAMAYHAMAEEAYAQYGSYFGLIDITHLTIINAEARRWMADWTRTHEVSGCAVFGGGLLQRTVVTLLSRAIALIRPTPFQVMLFKTEEEARAWIAKERMRQQSSQAAMPKSVAKL